MGKKKLRKKYTSAGKRTNHAHGILQEMKSKRSYLDKLENKIAAWKAGKNPWVTVATTQKNKPFVRVRANEYYGDYRNQPKEQNNNDANSVQ